MTNKEQQKKLVLKLSKEKKISVLSASKLLAENNWEYNKCINAPESPETSHIEQKLKKQRSGKKKDKVSQNENKQLSEVPRYNPDDPHFDWDLYCKNCIKYSKHPNQVPEPKQIGEGYWTMQEIVKFAKHITKPVDNRQSTAAEKLNTFNKKYKTDYKSWDEVSLLYDFTDKEILEYKDYISFYHLSKNRKACEVIFGMSPKDLKPIKEKAQTVFVLGRNFIK